MKRRRLLSVALLIVAGLVSFACGKERLREPIAQFQATTDAAATAISSYYTELNQYERDLYLEAIALDPELEVLETDAEGRPTPLLGSAFDPQAIHKRAALLRQLALYGERLSTLAGNEAPEAFKTNANSLATSLTSLAERFETSSTSTSDTAAADYVGPLGALAGVVGQAILERKRDRALRKAVLDAEVPVTSILDFLERDLDKYVESTRRTGQRQRLAELVALYNSTEHRDQMSLDERRTRLEEVRRAAEEVRLVTASKPSDAVRGLRTVHQALVKAARSGGARDLAAIFAALDDYQDVVKGLVSAVVKLKELREGGRP